MDELKKRLKADDKFAVLFNEVLESAKAGTLEKDLEKLELLAKEVSSLTDEDKKYQLSIFKDDSGKVTGVALLINEEEIKIDKSENLPNKYDDKIRVREDSTREFLIDSQTAISGGYDKLINNLDIPKKEFLIAKQIARNLVDYGQASDYGTYDKDTMKSIDSLFGNVEVGFVDGSSKIIVKGLDEKGKAALQSFDYGEGKDIDPSKSGQLPSQSGGNSNRGPRTID